MQGGPLVAGVQQGDVLAGKYRVDKVLGVGGMGVVVAAHHVQLDDKVAIKFLLPEALGNPETVARFAREARAAVKIKSEHVARVIDVGTLQNGAPYMVMEYLEGGDLEQWVRQKGRLPVEQAVEFVLQALEAIAEAHALGIVHRDLKPANLFCTMRSDGLLSVKVLDFGISKVTGMGASGPMGMTKTTAVMGSPLYMSPEQLESSRNVDARTDIWAIGVILYELITGRVPFAADSLPELVVKIISAPPDPMASLRPDVPPGIEQVIRRCLEKDKNRRYANLGELALALLDYGPKHARSSVERISRIIQASGLSTSDLDLPPPSSDAVGVQGKTFDSWGQTTRGAPAARRSKAAAVVAAGTVVVAAAAGAFFFMKKQAPAPPTEAAAATTVTTAAAVHAPAPAETPAPPPTAASALVPAASSVAAAPSAIVSAVKGEPAPAPKPKPIARPVQGPAPTPPPVAVKPASPGAAPAAAPATNGAAAYDDRK
jgi:serine/threonine-protein kinase